MLDNNYNSYSKRLLTTVLSLLYIYHLIGLHNTVVSPIVTEINIATQRGVISSEKRLALTIHTV